MNHEYLRTGANGSDKQVRREKLHCPNPEIRKDRWLGQLPAKTVEFRECKPLHPVQEIRGDPSPSGLGSYLAGL